MTSSYRIFLSELSLPERARASAFFLGLIFLCTTAAAQTIPAEGWTKQAASLLLYDSSSTLVSEIGLGHWEEAVDFRINVLEMRGGVSPNRRFAWTLEKNTVWNSSRTKKLEFKRNFRFFGNGGTELWRSGDIDVSAAEEPVSFSADGELLLVCLHLSSGSSQAWSAALKTYVGNTLAEWGPFPLIKGLALTPNGKYALVRSTVPDKSSTHTFIEIGTKIRKDIDSGDLLLGQARIEDDGKVKTGAKTIFDFAAPVPQP